MLFCKVIGLASAGARFVFKLLKIREISDFYKLLMLLLALLIPDFMVLRSSP